MLSRTFNDHLNLEITPKRILAVDGGGLRGVLTVAFLKKIKDILQPNARRDFGNSEVLLNRRDSATLIIDKQGSACAATQRFDPQPASAGE